MCGDRNPTSLGLRFSRQDEASVGGLFQSQEELQGYDGILHGGVIAALLDSAMTNCLFHAGVRAVTADLRVRYRHSIPAGEKVEVEARLIDSRPPLYRLRASIRMNGRTMAQGDARFMQTGELS